MFTKVKTSGDQSASHGKNRTRHKTKPVRTQYFWNYLRFLFAKQAGRQAGNFATCKILLVGRNAYKCNPLFPSLFVFGPQKDPVCRAAYTLHEGSESSAQERDDMAGAKVDYLPTGLLIATHAAFRIGR